MPDNTLLFETGNVRVGVSRCHEVAPDSSGVEVETEFTVVFPMRGLFVYHARDHRMVATAAVALFLNREDEHQVSHPAGGHDQSVFISVAIDAVDPFLAAVGSTFPRSSVVTDLTVHMAVREIAGRAADRQLDDLAVEEFAFNTIGQLLEAQLVRATSTRHRRLIADTEEYLAVHFQEDCDLHTIGRQVGASPHHLSRLFHRLTGCTLSARRSQLRLRHALHLLAEGVSDISTIAVEAGFYDHSHLVKTTRAQLGITPRQLRIALVTNSFDPGPARAQHLDEAT